MGIDGGIKCTNINETVAKTYWKEHKDNGLWNVLDNNCVSKTVQVLAASMGCETLNTFLLTPYLMIDILDEHQDTNCRKMNDSELQILQEKLKMGQRNSFSMVSLLSNWVSIYESTVNYLTNGPQDI